MLLNILIDDLEGGSKQNVNSIPGRKLIGRQGTQQVGQRLKVVEGSDCEGSDGTGLDGGGG